MADIEYPEGPMDDGEFEARLPGLVRFVVAFRRRQPDAAIAITRLTLEQRARVDREVNATIAHEDHHG